MDLLKKIPFIERIRQANNRALVLELDSLRKAVGVTTDIREALAESASPAVTSKPPIVPKGVDKKPIDIATTPALPVGKIQVGPHHLHKGTFTHQGRMRAPKLTDQPAYRSSWPIQRILFRNIFEILQNIKYHANDKKLEHIEQRELAEVSNQMAKSLVIVENAIQRKSPAQEGKTLYSRWWKNACRSIPTKEHEFILNSLRNAAAFFYTNTHPETAEKLSTACRIMIHQMEGGHNPSILSSSAYSIGSTMEVVGETTGLRLLEHAGKALETISRVPGESTIPIE